MLINWLTDAHSRRAEGKRKGDRERNRETDKPNEVETTSVQVGEGTRSRRVLNWLDKELRRDTLIFLALQSNKFKSSSFKLNRGG